MRASIRSALTRALNEHHGRRTWFADSPSRRTVRGHDHFDYLVLEYLPAHAGICWVRADDRRAALRREEQRDVKVCGPNRQIAKSPNAYNASMPLYEYKSLEDNETIELLRPMREADAPVPDPKGKGRKFVRTHSTFTVAGSPVGTASGHKHSGGGGCGCGNPHGPCNS